MKLDESFTQSYEAEIKGEFDTPEGFIYIPARPALIVEIRPRKGKPWTGVFGADEGRYVTGLFTTPDQDTLCVVSNGKGYGVDAQNPDQWLEIDCSPVRFVLPFVQHGLLVFGDFIELVAYGPDPNYAIAPVWRSSRLGYDDLEITRVTDDRIEGRAWNAPDDLMRGFSVDVRTGKHEGGAYRLEQ